MAIEAPPRDRRDQGTPEDDPAPSFSHPETRCMRCGGRNLWSWHAPSPLWNAVMRGPSDLESRWPIVCPQCFAELAESAGVVRPLGTVWCLRADLGIAVDLPGMDRDGRVWDADRCLWIEGSPT